MSFNLVETIDDLDYLNNELLSRSYVGVDTEFRRTTKENMRLALLQINDTEEIYLIDTIMISNPEASCSFLFSDSVKKVFHSCKEDLEAIYSWTGKKMTNLFDTQLADAFLNGQYSISYQALVNEKIGIILDKAETRSNWIRRPLTDAQLHYAASDVEFLIELFSEQRKALIETNKYEWYKEELEFISSKFFVQVTQEDNITSILSKSEERALLSKFNEIILHLAEIESINPTMFFSKKSQKDFLRLVLKEGLEGALNEITHWRRMLIKKPLETILQDI